MEIKLTKREKQMLTIALKHCCLDGQFQYYMTDKENEQEPNVADTMIDKLIAGFDLDWDYMG